MFGKIWDWIKQHAVEVVAGSVGVIVAAYLIWQGQQSAAGAQSGTTAITQPATGAGTGGGGTSTTGTTTTSSTPTLPYNPDFSVLSNITDKVLSGLYSQEYNLELQINQATLAGNTSLVSTLTGSLNSIQNQIASYVPASTGAGVTAANVTTASNQWENVPTSTTSTWNPATAFNNWLTNVYANIPGAATLTTNELQNAFNTINSSVAFNGSSLFRDPTQAAAWWNAYIANPNNAPPGTLVWYTGQALQTLNQATGAVTTTTPPPPAPTTPAPAVASSTPAISAPTLSLPGIANPVVPITTSPTQTSATSLPVLNVAIPSTLVTGTGGS